MLCLRKVACLLALFGAFSAFARELPGEEGSQTQQRRELPGKDDSRLKRELPGDSGGEE
jgi:hypothetical protein